MAPNRISSITELTANSTPMADVSVRVPWNPSLQLVWSRKTLTYLTVQLWNVWFWASLKRCDIFWRADDSFWERLPALTIWVVWCWCFVKMLTLKPTQNPPFADRSVIVKDSWLSKWNSRSAQVNGGCQNRLRNHTKDRTNTVFWKILDASMINSEKIINKNPSLKDWKYSKAFCRSFVGGLWGRRKRSFNFSTVLNKEKYMSQLPQFHFDVFGLSENISVEVF